MSQFHSATDMPESIQILKVSAHKKKKNVAGNTNTTVYCFPNRVKLHSNTNWYMASFTSSLDMI